MSYWHIGWPSDIYTYRLTGPFHWEGPVMFKSLMKRKYTFTCDRSGQCETIGDFFRLRWAVFLIWISDRSFCRRSIGTRIDATLWRVRMISIKRVYPSRRGVGSSAMRVDGTSEYEISRRFDVSEETARLEMIARDEEGWIAAPCREKEYGKNISFRGVNIPRDNRGGHLRLQFADSEGLLSVFSSGLVMQRSNVMLATLSCAIKCRLCGQVFVNAGRLTWNWPPFKYGEGLRPLRVSYDVGSLLWDKSGERWHNFVERYRLFLSGVQFIPGKNFGILICFQIVANFV